MLIAFLVAVGAFHHVEAGSLAADEVGGLFFLALF